MKMRKLFAGPFLAWLVLLPVQCTAWEISSYERVVFPAEEMYEAEDLSGVAAFGRNLAVVSDEGDCLQILHRNGERSFGLAGIYQYHENGLRRHNSREDAEKATRRELDLEAVSYSDGFLYVIGSHSKKRKKVKPYRTGKSVRENLQRFSRVLPQPDRRVMFRVAVTAEGVPAGETESFELSKMLMEHAALFFPFFSIPAKENGLDIEGLAVSGDTVFVGFRGPVFNGGWVPVGVFGRNRGQNTRLELRFVRLGGRGIRGMAAVDGRLLLLAGPVGNEGSSFALYSWDMADCFPGEEGTSCSLSMLTEIAGKERAKPEGLTVLSEDENGVQLLVLFDGPRGGSPVVFRLKF